MKLLFGRVTSFGYQPSNPLQSYGFILGEDKTSYYFRLGDCYKIVPGVTEPVFDDELWKSSVQQGDKVVFLSGEVRVSGTLKPRVIRWGLRKFFDSAKRIIDSRPVYRVVGKNLFKGQELSNNPDEQVVCGTLPEILSQFPEVRGIGGDKLGPLYQSGPCQRKNVWYVWQNADWFLCEDPREIPLLPATTFVLDVVNEDDAELENLARSVCGNNRGVNHSRPQNGINRHFGKARR